MIRGNSNFTPMACIIYIVKEYIESNHFEWINAFNTCRSFGHRLTCQYQSSSTGSDYTSAFMFSNSSTDTIKNISTGITVFCDIAVGLSKLSRMLFNVPIYDAKYIFSTSNDILGNCRNSGSCFSLSFVRTVRYFTNPFTFDRIRQQDMTSYQSITCFVCIVDNTGSTFSDINLIRVSISIGVSQYLHVLI